MCSPGSCRFFSHYRLSRIFFSGQSNLRFAVLSLCSPIFLLVVRAVPGYRGLPFRDLMLKQEWNVTSAVAGGLALAVGAAHAFGTIRRIWNERNESGYPPQDNRIKPVLDGFIQGKGWSKPQDAARALTWSAAAPAMGASRTPDQEPDPFPPGSAKTPWKRPALQDAWPQSAYRFKHQLVPVTYDNPAIGQHRILVHRTGTKGGIPVFLSNGGPGYMADAGKGGDHTFYDPKKFDIIWVTGPGCEGDEPTVTNPHTNLELFKEFGPDEMQETVLKVREALGITRKGVVGGFSWGATLSDLLFFNHPDKFAGLLNGSNFTGAEVRPDFNELADFYLLRLVGKLPEKGLVDKEVGDRRLLAKNMYADYPARKWQQIAAEAGRKLDHYRASGENDPAVEAGLTDRLNLATDKARYWQDLGRRLGHYDKNPDGKLTDEDVSVIQACYNTTRNKKLHLSRDEIRSRPWLLMMAAYHELLIGENDRISGIIWEEFEEFITSEGQEQLDAFDRIHKAFHHGAGLVDNDDLDRSQAFWQVQLFPRLRNQVVEDAARGRARGMAVLVQPVGDMVCPPEYTEYMAGTLYDQANPDDLKVVFQQTDGSHAVTPTQYRHWLVEGSEAIARHITGMEGPPARRGAWVYRA